MLEKVVCALPFAVVAVILVTDKDELLSASVSSEITVPAPLVELVTVSVNWTVSVSATPTGASLTPVIVIVSVAVSVAVPSDNVYVKTSFTVSLTSSASVTF